MLTQVRPYISDRGAKISGYCQTIREVEDTKAIEAQTPMPNDTKNILKVKLRTVGFVIPYKVATSGRPGAIIALPSGDTNV